MAEKEYIERETTCKDCICYDVCFVVRHNGDDRVLRNSPCKHFRNKANVVEVVRCKDCIHRDKKGICEKFRQRYPFFPEDDFYCDFGAKMDGKGDAV